MSRRDQERSSGSYDLGVFFQNIREAEEEREARIRRERDLFSTRSSTGTGNGVPRKTKQSVPKPAERAEKQPGKREEALFFNDSEPEQIELVSDNKKPAMKSPHETVLPHSNPDEDITESDLNAILAADVTRALGQSDVIVDGDFPNKLGVILSDKTPRFKRVK